YRLGLAESRDKARQLVNHGHITVNGKTVSIPSFSVKAGDIVAVKESSKKSKVFSTLSEKIKKQSVPGWLNLEPAKLSGKVLGLPKKDDLATNLNPQMIVEYYSR
ncbi:30S ribosomal protein S4, partial [Candidatus Falkowbacteria bacterium]|nr:30S ribosomal protein S4 [Candidatus Falkowbacteria bacterium]